ncbi:MAG: type II secretion system protein GspC [Thermodesulfovibrionales bacterium]
MELNNVFRYLNNQKTLQVVTLCLGLVLALTVLFLVRDIISISLTPKEKTVKGAAKPAEALKHSLTDYAPVLTSNPFGFPAGELKLMAASTGPSVSQTDLTLIGTVAGRKDISYAILADKSGQQDVFRVGSTVFGLGKLSRVEMTKVFIGSQGREIEIKLKDIADIRDIKQADAPTSASSASFGRRVGDSTYQIDQQRVQQAIEKPDQIMTDARFVPNIVEGKQQGFILREVKPGGIYSSLGLQNGDILLRINEFTISNPETALQAFTALRGIDRAQLDVIRNSAKMTMTYQIR